MGSIRQAVLKIQSAVKKISNLLLNFELEVSEVEKFECIFIEKPNCIYKEENRESSKEENSKKKQSEMKELRKFNEISSCICFLKVACRCCESDVPDESASK